METAQEGAEGLPQEIREARPVSQHGRYLRGIEEQATYCRRNEYFVVKGLVPVFLRP